MDCVKIGFIKESVLLQPHQERAINRLENTPGILLYHGLGSGKTLTSLAAAQRFGLRPVIVGPASLKHNFPAEIKKHNLTVKQPVISTYSKPAEANDKDLVVFDEAHRMGRLESQRSHYPDAIKGNKTIFATGTPIRNYPHELIPILRGLGIKAGRDTKAFDKSFIKQVKEKPNIFARVFKGVKPGVRYEAQNMSVLRKALHNKVDYYMPDKKGYPSVSTEEIDVTMTPEQYSAYKMALKNKPSLAYKIRKGIAPSKSEAKSLNSFLMASRQISNIPGEYNLKSTIKDAPKLIKAVDEIDKRYRTDPNYKGVTYSNFIGHGIGPIAKMLKDKGISYAVFTGKQTDKQKADIIKKYNSGKIKQLLISGAGSEGLDLKGTKLMQLMEPHWNQSLVKQVQGRAIRYKSHDYLPEKDRNVHVQKFYAKPPKEGFIFKHQSKGSDEYMKMLSDRKEGLNKQFLDVLKGVGSEKVAMSDDTKRKLRGMGYGLATDIPISFLGSMAGSKLFSKNKVLGATLGGMVSYPFTIAAELKGLEKKSEFAPGIPSKTIKPINIPNGFTRIVVQEHNAKKAGKHYDIRIKGGSDAFSWATRELPNEYGDKVGVIEQPTHSASYMDFEGQLPEGYGEGSVKKIWDETIDIISADNKKIKFFSPKKGEFALINTGNGWLFIKMKKFIGNINFKPKYKEKKIKDIDINAPTILQPKIDGAHSIIELNPGDKMNRIYSYRVSKKNGIPIEHTHQIPAIRDLVVPKNLSNTTLRTELFAKKNNKAIEPNEISGILNSGLVKSRLNQEKIPLVPMLFDITKFHGKDVTDKPYRERFELLKDISKETGLMIPEIAETPKQKNNLINRISSGKYPLTREGVIEWGDDTVTKSKIRPEADVYIRKIDPVLKGFSYSNTPTGKISGRVGTGFSDKTWKDMVDNPDRYIGNVARIESQGMFGSGAHRAPSFKSLHIEKSIK